ncbi:MAG: DUF2339 domain-containing protein [Alphaproteobacteria bacterium]|nr:DUF2339 domain-containing protein [Alphaproteobacteria bacterium]
MAAIGALFVLGYLLLPIVAMIWAYSSGKRIDQLAENVGFLLRRAEREGRGDAAPKKAEPASAEKPAEKPTAAAASGVTVTPAVQSAPAAQSLPRKDSIFADNSVYKGADGEEWVEISDAPAAKTTYFSDTESRTDAPRTGTVHTAARADGEDVFEKAWHWLGENWMLVTGALFVFLSISWLVRYALVEDLITAEMRIGAGFVLGAVLAGIGYWRMKFYPQQGAIFLVLGTSAVMLTMFAARELYGFFTPAAMLSLAFVTAGFVTLQALRANMPVLSYAGLLTAMAAPAMTNVATPSFAGLFGYLAVVLAATLWVVLMTGWGKNILFALVMTTFYSIPFWEVSSRLPSKDAGLYTAFAFAAVFFIADMVGHFRAVRNRLADILMPLLMAGFLVVWIGNAAASDMRAMWLLLWAAVFSAGSALLSRRTGAQSVFYTYMAVAAVLVVATTAIELRGTGLIVMLTLQSAGLTLLCRHVLRMTTGTTVAAFTMLLPLCLGVGSLDAAKWTGAAIPQGHALVLLMLAAVPLALAWYFYVCPDTREGDKQKTAPETTAPHMAEICFWVISGSLYGYAFIWRVAHALIPQQDFATALCMIAYSIVGIAAYMLGHSGGRLYVRYYGLGLLGMVIARLLLVDLPEMPVAARIVMFFGVGVLLLATAFIRYRRKDTGAAE